MMFSIFSKIFSLGTKKKKTEQSTRTILVPPPSQPPKSVEITPPSTTLFKNNKPIRPKFGARVLLFTCSQIEKRRCQRSLDLFENVFWSEVLERKSTSYLLHVVTWKHAFFTINDEYVFFKKDPITNLWSSQTVPPEQQAFFSFTKSEHGKVPLKYHIRWQEKHRKKCYREFKRLEQKSKFVLL